MVIDNKFNIGDIVYLTTDVDQYPRLVAGINVKPGGFLLYELQCGERNGTAYEIELSAKKRWYWRRKTDNK